MGWSGMVDKAKVKAGQRVLIHGAVGGIGNLALQFAKSYGAYVIGIASAHNTDFLKTLGADEVIDYNTNKFEDMVSDMDVVLMPRLPPLLMRITPAIRFGFKRGR